MRCKWCDSERLNTSSLHDFSRGESIHYYKCSRCGTSWKMTDQFYKETKMSDKPITKPLYWVMQTQKCASYYGPFESLKEAKISAEEISKKSQNNVFHIAKSSVYWLNKTNAKEFKCK